MNSSIGPLTFIRMAGPEVAGLNYQIKEFSRAGIDGVGFEFQAAKAPLCQKDTVEGVANAAIANTAEETYKLLKGSLVVVVDDHGRTRGNVMILDVTVTRKTAMLLDVPNNYSYHVEATWTLKATTA